MQEWLIAYYDVLKDFTTPAVTLVGFLISIILAVAGLRTFGRWKREKIEEKRIEIAFESLSLAYESKSVFDQIRNPDGYEAEWNNMPVKEGETEDERRMRGPTFGILMRLHAHNDFFDRVWKLQPRTMAVFGEKAEEAFNNLHKARAYVLSAARALTWEMPVKPAIPTEEDFKKRMQLRADIWAGFGNSEEGGDRVERRLQDFVNGIKLLCQPVVDREFRR